MMLLILRIKRALKHPVRFVIAVSFFVVSTLCVSPTEYREQVRSAEIDVWQLAELERGGEEEREMIAEILEHVPASERIEWQGGVVVTDNQWLIEKLDLYQKETDETLRRSIASEMGERLSAIVLMVGQLENAAAADATKDSDKQKIAEILSRPEYQKAERDSQSLISRWLESIVNKIAELFPSWSPPASGDAGFGALTYWLQIFLYIVVIGVIAFLLYKFAPAVFPGLRRKKDGADGDRIILGERLAANTSSSDLLAEAEKLAREGDLRSAIRKGYIALLCDLSDRKRIRLTHEKTNRDYLRELRTNTGLQNDVRRLTEKFELHWYGEHSADIGDWEEFRSGYRKAVDQ